MTVTTEPLGPNTHDLTGRQFGRLTVLNYAGKTPWGGAKWLCQCNCSDKTIKVVMAKSLIESKLPRGGTRSCGCMFREIDRTHDLSGQRFGKLVALYQTEKHGRWKGAMWAAQCDCDPEGRNIKAYQGGGLVSGSICSCGCARKTGEIVRSKKVRDRAEADRLKRWAMEPGFVLRARVKARVRSCLKDKKAQKTQSVMDCLAFTIDELETHLRTTIPTGYTWTDYLSGVLHLDHKKPLSSFSFTSTDDPGFKEAWALSNLQLLTADDNLRKHRRTDWTPNEIEQNRPVVPRKPRRTSSSREGSGQGTASNSPLARTAVGRSTETERISKSS